ncbi:MAG: ATP-binding protein [Lachnospiraceae bacterium]|jgi:PAS domain S-box-containing protein|nr:ATP-binding protein [Lachnospiraceae bacterium]
MTKNRRDEDTERLLRCALRTLLEHTEDYIYIKDKDIICRAASDSFLKLMGAVSADEVCGKPDSELFGRELAGHYRSDDLKVIDEGRSIVGEVENAKPANGKNHWGRTSKYPVRDDSGEIIGLLGISTDVTDDVNRQRKEETFQKLTELFNNIPGGYGISHFENGFFCSDMESDGLFLIPYLTPDHVHAHSGRRFAELVFEPDRQVLIDEYERVKSLPDETGNVDLRIHGSDGKLHWLNFRFRRAYLKDGLQYFYVAYIDVDSQKLSELEMLKARQMYDDAAQEARLLVWTYDPETDQAAMMQSGFTQEFITRLGIPAFIEHFSEKAGNDITARDRKDFLAACRRIREGDDFAECRVGIEIPGEAELLYERITFRRISDKNGKMLTVHCCGQDITGEMKLREKYEREMDNLRHNNGESLIAKGHCNLTQNLLLEYDSSERKENSSFRPGITYDKVYEGLLAQAYMESDRSVIREKLSRQELMSGYRQGETQTSLQYRRRTGGREYIWVSMTVHIYAVPETGELELFSYAYDITERKMNDTMMQLIAAKYFEYICLISIPDSSVKFLIETGADTCFDKGVKIPYEEYCEYMRSNHIGQERLRAFNEAVSLENIAEGLKAGEKYTATYMWLEQGKVRCRKMDYSWYDREAGIVLAAAADVTAFHERDQKQLLEVQRSRQAAERASEAKSAFLSTMSHDLRTPLNGMIGFTEIALQESSPAKTKEYLEKIRSSGVLLKNLVNDTLELSRIESGKMLYEPEAVQCPALLQEVVTALQPSADLAKVDLETDFSACPEEVVCTDRLKVQKILLNLLSNAIKYTPENGRIIVRVMKMDAPVRGRTHRMIVEDNGIGMSRAYLKRIYEPFSQEKHRQENVSGTGLGMTIVKRITDLIKGTIVVESTPGKGTRFTVELPMPATDQQPADRKMSEEPVSTLGGRRILLCEDNDINAEIVTILLKDREMTVDWAKNGREGFDMFRASAAGTYDAILMDLQMPVMDGIEATKRIRKLKREDAATVPIIAFTGNAFEEDVRRCLSAGMNEHIAKPVDPAHLFRVLSSLIH